MADDDGWVLIGELVPEPDGEWSGTLFENPAMGIQPMLGWAFSFSFLDELGYPLTLRIEYVQLQAESWQHLAGLRVANAGVAEATADYCDIYFRFAEFDLELIE